MKELQHNSDIRESHFADGPKHVRTVTFRLYWAAFVVSIGGLVTGTCANFSSQALPSLEKDARFAFARNSEEESWIGSLATFGALFGSLAVGVIGGKLGRKRATHVASIPAIVGWILIALAQNVIMLYIGRALTGFSYGIFVITTASYISEISTPEVRGRLLVGPVIMATIGATLTNGLGVILDWVHLSIVLCSLPIVLAVLLFFIPESPFYLVFQESETEARKALLWLRGKDYAQLDEEMAEIVRTLQANKELSQSRVSIFDLFQPQTLKPLLISITIQLIQQGSGFNVVLSYCTNILETTGSSLNPALAAMYLSIIQIPICLFSSLIMDKVGRKVWLVLSGTIMTASLLTLGIYCKLTEAGITTSEKFGWIPPSCVYMYISGSCLGYVSLGYLVMAEILVCAETRSLATGLTGILNSVFAFIGTKTYPLMVTTLKPYGTFWIYGGFALIGVVFPPLFMFETRGKSLEEIQRHYLRQGRVHSSNISTNSTNNAA